MINVTVSSLKMHQILTPISQWLLGHCCLLIISKNYLKWSNSPPPELTAFSLQFCFPLILAKVMRITTVQPNFLSSLKFKAIADLHFLDSWKLMASQILVVLVIHHLTLLPCLTVIISLRFSSHKILITEMVFQQISLPAVGAAPPRTTATVLFPLRNFSASFPGNPDS